MDFKIIGPIRAAETIAVTTRGAELHWFEATGIGSKKFKIKRYLEP